MASVVFVCSAIGCSGGSSSSVPAALVEVRGTVTLGRTPLPRVMVVLMPIGESGTAARGVTDGTGRYTLRHQSGVPGAEPGTYKVLFRALSPADRIKSDRTDWPQYSDPAQTPWRVTVAAGKGPFDFDLQTPPATQAR